MNLQEIRDEIRRRLNDTSTVFWTDADINAVINEGYAEISDASEWHERQGRLKLLKDRTYYNLTEILPDTFLSPRRIFNVTTSRWLEPSSPRRLDGTYRQWELNSGEPEQYFMRGHSWLGVWPKRASDTTVLRIYYTAIPPDLSSDTDIPGFPEEFHLGLAEYALAELLFQEREYEKASRYWIRYKQHEGSLMSYVSGRVVVDRLPRVRA